MSDTEDGHKEEMQSRSGGSQHSDRDDVEDDKNERYSNHSRAHTRSRTRSPSPGEHKSHKKTYSRSRSRSRSRSQARSRKSHRSSRYRSRSRSPKRYKSSRYSYSRSRSGSYSPHRSSSRRDKDDYRRSRSRSPMSNRRRHLGNRDNPLPGRCLGVFGLSLYTTEAQLNHIFSKFGPVEKVQVIIDAKTGRSRGFCFVYFENHEDAKAAKEQCTGMEIDGRQIRVDYSITLRAHTPTPGIYMGKPTYMEDRKWKHRNYDDYHYGGGGGGGGGGGRYNHYSRRSPSPYYRSRRRYRSRSYSYSPNPPQVTVSTGNRSPYNGGSTGRY